jgi:DNA-binding NarL/FixJ family response regulator
MKKHLFSEKDIQFIQLCASDMNYRQIAEKMYMSPKTVENYREKLFDRLNVKTRTRLVVVAIKQNLIGIPD